MWQKVCFYFRKIDTFSFEFFADDLRVIKGDGEKDFIRNLCQTRVELFINPQKVSNYMTFNTLLALTATFNVIKTLNINVIWSIDLFTTLDPVDCLFFELFIISNEISLKLNGKKENLLKRIGNNSFLKCFLLPSESWIYFHLLFHFDIPFYYISLSRSLLAAFLKKNFLLLYFFLIHNFYLSDFHIGLNITISLFIVILSVMFFFHRQINNFMGNHNFLLCYLVSFLSGRESFAMGEKFPLANRSLLSTWINFSHRERLHIKWLYKYGIKKNFPYIDFFV